MLPKTVKSALILVLIAVTSLLAADTKVRTVQGISTKGLLFGNPPPPEVTVYVHDMAQRVEFVGYVADFIGPRKQPAPHTAVITHCDTGMVYQLDLDGQEYREFKLTRFPSEDEFAKQRAREQKDDEKSAQGSTVDTGETKDFHGHLAKHLITTIKGKNRELSYGEVVDGWYLDLPRPGCAPEYFRRAPTSMETSIGVLFVGSTLPSPGTPLEPRSVRSAFIYTAFLPGGLAAQQTSTQHQTIKIRGQKSDNAVLAERKIVEFSEAPLDPALFEVPPGFKKVRDLYQHKKH